MSRWATIPLATVLAACLPASILACVGSFQDSNAQADQGSSQRAAQTLPNVKRPTGWHHFGPSGNATGTNKTPAAPAGSGNWRHFGPQVRNGATPRAAPVNAPRVASAAAPNQVTHITRVTHASVVPRRASGARIAELEKSMWEAVNRDRANPQNVAETNGRALPLLWNDELAAVARAHSQDMVRRQFFDHVDPDGRSGGERIEDAGIRWQSTGENIAMYNDVGEAEAAFMREPRFEPNHRGNILNPKYTAIGIGIVQGPNGLFFITQDFVESPAGSRAPTARSTRLSPSHRPAASASPAE